MPKSTADELIAMGVLEERYIVIKLRNETDEDIEAVRDLIKERAITTVPCVVVEDDWPIFQAVVDAVVGCDELVSKTAADAKINDVYAQRNALAVAFCKAAILLGWRAGRGIDPASCDAAADWGHVVYVDTPGGQVSWHIHPDQVSLLDGLPEYSGVWDGEFRGRNPDWVGGVK